MPALHHIVIAESESHVRALLARIVARTYPACRISVVSDGAAALAVVENQGADLLIATYRLLSLSGIELVRALRTRQLDVPTLLISSEPVEASALVAGADRFLLKPFTLVEIQRILRELLPPQDFVSS
jgi:DNA-binding response OmpR family regulator